MSSKGFIPVRDSAEFEEFCNTYSLGEKDAPELVFGRCEIKSTVSCRIDTVLRSLQNQPVAFEEVCFESRMLEFRGSIRFLDLSRVRPADIGLETMTFRKCVFRNVELWLNGLTQCVFKECVFELSDSSLPKIWIFSKKVEFRSCRFSINGAETQSEVMKLAPFVELNFSDCTFTCIPSHLFDFIGDLSASIAFQRCRFYHCDLVSCTDLLETGYLVFSNCSFHACGFEVYDDPADIRIAFERCLFSETFIVVSNVDPDYVKDQFYLYLGITRDTSAEFEFEDGSLKVPITKWLEKHAISGNSMDSLKSME